MVAILFGTAYVHASRVRIVDGGVQGAIGTVVVMLILVTSSLFLLRRGSFRASLAVSGIGLSAILAYVVLIAGLWLGELRAADGVLKATGSPTTPH